MEVPIIQPLVNRAPESCRFIVNDTDRSIQHISSHGAQEDFGNASSIILHEATKNEEAKNSNVAMAEYDGLEGLNNGTPTEEFEKQHLKGCASAAMHSLTIPKSTDSSVLVSTCALVTNPNIMSISVIPANDINPNDTIHSSRAELDLSGLKLFGPHPIKTVTFLEIPVQSENSVTAEDSNTLPVRFPKNVILRFNLMDSAGRVLVIRLAFSTLNGLTLMSSDEFPEVEVHDFSIHSVSPNNNDSSRDFLSSNDVEVSYHTIEWLSPHNVVFYRKPEILCADLQTDKIKQWNTKSTTDMTRNLRGKSRRSTFSMFSFIARIGEDEEDEIAPVSAFSSTRGESTSLDQDNTCLFSLHTDGTVRLWSIKLQSLKFQNSLCPHSVRLLQIPRNCSATAMMRAYYQIPAFEEDDEESKTNEGEIKTCNPPLPESTLWSSEFDAVSMTSRLYAADQNTFALAIAVKTLSPPYANMSPVSILVVHGSFDSMYTEDAEGCIVLTIPPHVESVTQISFSPNKRCELHGLFSSKNESKTIIARYPPSCVALLSSVPEILYSTLDEWSRKEVDAISNITTQNFLSMANEESMEEDLQRKLESIDSYFMRLLYSPNFFGISGNRPLSSCVQKACYSVVPEYSPSNVDKSEKYASEAVTLLAVREWVRIDETNKLSKTRNNVDRSLNNKNTNNGTSTSVYHAFSTQSKRPGEALEDVGIDDNESSNKLDIHLSRWKKLLVAIWKEHISLLSPYFLVTLREDIMGSSSNFISSLIVRGGVTSLVVNSRDSFNNDTNHVDNAQPTRFDQAVLKLDYLSKAHYDAIAMNKESNREIMGLEEKLNQIVVSGSLMSPQSNNQLTLRIERLGGLRNETNSQAMMEASDVIKNCLQKFDDNSLFEWACSIPDKFPSGLPYQFASKALDGESGFLSDSKTKNDRKVSIELTTCAVYASQLYIKSARSLMLSRCILLSSLLDSRQLATDAIESAWKKATQLYLQVASVDWVSKQFMEKEVILNTTMWMHPEQNCPTGRCPISGTVLDAFISFITPSNSVYSLRCAIDIFFKACSALRRDAIPKYSLNKQIDGSNRLSTTLTPLVEFGLLKRWHQPRLGLRLLAPSFYDCTTLEKAKIKILVSECLLVEATSLTTKGLHSNDQSRALRERAANLYKEANDDYDDCFDVTGDDIEVDYVFHALTKNIDNWSKCIDTPTESIKGGNSGAEVLSELRNLMITNETGNNFVDLMKFPLMRLARRDFCKSLVFAWITNRKGSDPYSPFFANENPENQIRLFFHKLRSISHLLDRIDLIERHTMDHELLLKCTNDALEAMTSEIPNDMIYDMAESVNLWSAAFQHSMAISDWETALDACKKNPSPTRRKAGVRRLVVGMVGAGALGDMLQLASYYESGDGDFGVDECEEESIASSIDQLDDFYEAAISVLNEQIHEQKKRIRHELEKSTATQDLWCCLFSLHASHGDWRRAAKAMDDWHEFLMSTEMKSSPSESVVENLSRAAITCASSIHLVSEKKHRFLLDDNYTPRMLEPSGKKSQQNETSNQKKESIHFKTCHSIEQRALLSLAWKTLSKSKAQNDSKVKRSLPKFTETVMQLARSGCYMQAIILAKKSCDITPNGEKQFSRILSCILQDFLVPATIALSRQTPINIDEFDNEWENQFHSLAAPNISQLIHAMTTDDNQKFPSYIGEQWRPTKVDESAKSKACMELIKRLTIAHSNSTNTLAIDVAEQFLELDNNRALLPIWLEDLLLGRVCVGDKGISEESAMHSHFGLFANPPQRQGSAADPASLLRLYIKRGLYVAACHVVTKVLTNHGNLEERRSSAMKRTPEKGDIDFIPYALIDMLDEMIQHLDSPNKGEILEARNSMIRALEFHFEMVKISEMGLQSARALQK